MGVDALEYEIEYNKAMEFINAIFKYSNSKQQQSIWNSKVLKNDPAKELLDFSPSKEVKDWLKYIDTHISPFLRNDLIFIAGKTINLLDVCFDLVIKKDLKEPCELIETLKSLDSWTLVELIYEKYDSNISLENDDMIIKSALTEICDEEISSIFMQIKNHPEEYKTEVIKIFETFYELYYNPFENKVYTFMKERCNKHNKTFKENPINFLNTIGLGDYSKFIIEKKKFRIFVSFYIDLGVFHFNIDNDFIMLFGHTIEHRFENKLTREKCKALFKALSDETRLDIIKITSQRPWYNKELADYFNLSTATLSYHLNLLLDLDIINFEPSVNNRYYYTTDKKHLKKLFDMALNEIVE
jgi:DNA-binding transcriptional ArsR family regulator